METVAKLVEIPAKTVDKSALYYNTKTSEWTLDSQLYSGYAVSYYKEERLKEKFGVLNGKKQNEAINWFPD